MLSAINAMVDMLKDKQMWRSNKKEVSKLFIIYRFPRKILLLILMVLGLQGGSGSGSGAWEQDLVSPVYLSASILEK